MPPMARSWWLAGVLCAVGCAASTGGGSGDDVPEEDAAPAALDARRGGGGNGGAVGAGGSTGADAATGDTRPSPAPDGGQPPDAGRSVDAGATGPEPLQTSVPVMYIDTMNKVAVTQRDVDIPGRVRIIEDHDGSLMDLARKIPALDAAMVIEVHGNSSSGFPKKSFNIELRQDQDQTMTRQAGVMGMPSESDW